jgi:hypothetical protein
MVFLAAFTQSCALKKAHNFSDAYSTEGYKLVWSDEFDQDGIPTLPIGIMKKVLYGMKNCNGTNPKMPFVKMAS